MNAMENHTFNIAKCSLLSKLGESLEELADLTYDPLLRGEDGMTLRSLCFLCGHCG